MDVRCATKSFSGTPSRMSCATSGGVALGRNALAQVYRNSKHAHDVPPV